jgi:hypothetical protein
MKEFRVPRADKDALDFSLVYDRFVKDEETGEESWVEQTDKFQARGSVPGNLLISLTASMTSGVGVQAHELQRLLYSCMVKEDKERFIELLDDPDTAVPIELLGEITQWLAGEYSNRPT